MDTKWMANRRARAAAVSLLVCACFWAPPPVLAASASDGYWPTTGWRTSSPEAQGINGEALDAALYRAQKMGLALHGVVIIRHGYIVKEKYFAPFNVHTPHELYSCTKSFVSALTGIALDRGSIPGLSAPVLGFFSGRQFANPDARKKSITVENLLTMSAGLGWVEGDATYHAMYATERDWVKYVLDLPMTSDPGKQFLYDSGCSHLLSTIIQKKTGGSTYEFARDNLFSPMGIRDPAWERDPEGVAIGGWGLELAPRDMAKLGYLYLHDGVWDGRQLVPSAWVRASTQAHMSVNAQLSYGYQWWVDRSEPMFAALGRYGQSIFVVPGRDLVVVFTARIESSDPEMAIVKGMIVPACR